MELFRSMIYDGLGKERLELECFIEEAVIKMCGISRKRFESADLKVALLGDRTGGLDIVLLFTVV